MSGEVLQLRDVRQAFGSGPARWQVLDGVDLAVGAGEVVALFGRSGSGKSTLLTIAAGMERPDAGTAAIRGVAGTRGVRWRELAFVPQSLGLLAELTIAENVELPARLHADPRRATGWTPAEVLDRLGLSHLAGRLPDEVSLGEQQRAAIARAAVARPVVFVADEPVSHQNPDWAVAVMDMVSDLGAVGTACLLATHDESAVRIAHRVVELRDGRIREVSSAS